MEDIWGRMGGRGLDEQAEGVTCQGQNLRGKVEDVARITP